MSDNVTPESDILRFYSAAEIAEMFNIKVGTVRIWIRTGKLKATKINKRYRVSHQEILRFVNERHGEKE